MKLPKVVAKQPVIEALEPGSYWWCACGLSAKQPMCDGTHKGTDFAPVKFTITEKKKVALCQCKHTANKPFCDGSHSKLPSE